MTDRLNQTIQLSDGRTLGYAEYGVPEGKPIMYFHGHPSSRLDWALFDPDYTLSQTGIRLIAPDRPGHGLSDFQTSRALLDWPDTVIELADRLGLDSFAVLGISGGGPYAAACAYKIPDRLTNVGIVCGMGPAEAEGAKQGSSWTYAGKGTLARNAMLKLTALGLQRDPEEFQSRFIAQARATLPPVDVQLLEDEEFAREFLSLTFKEALRNGIKGASHDAKLYARPWGFKLEEIGCEVHLWHGEQDRQVLPSVGRHVAGAIPNCQATFLADEGHLSLPRNQLRTILETLLS